MPGGKLEHPQELSRVGSYFLCDVPGQAGHRNPALDFHKPLQGFAAYLGLFWEAGAPPPPCIPQPSLCFFQP
jgi:hypothetical protein